MRKLVAAAFALGLAVAPAAPAASQVEESVTYSVKEARAYAYKASLSKTVIELLPECDPEEDEYQCDESKYNHKENCPKSLEIGPRGKAPKAKPPPDVEPFKGGSGKHVGPQDDPPQGPPVRINRLLSLGKLTHLSGILEAGGMASSLYVDLSGRAEPEGHTQSEAFSNLPAYEERCIPENDDGEVDEDDHEHFLSRSGEDPSTYHLAECKGPRCGFGLGTYGFNAERARTIVHLRERNEELLGDMRAVVEGLTFGGKDGLFVRSVITHASFKTDGTPQGLRWTVTTTASGARLGGRPIALPPGDTVSEGGLSVGVAEPYVDVPKDGRALTIVAPGLHVGHREQAAFFAGVEVSASLGLGTPFVFSPVDEPTVLGGGPSFGGGSGGFDVGGGNGLNFGTTEVDPAEVAAPDEPPVAAGEPSLVRIYEVATGVGAVPAIVGTGALMWFLLMSRWLQRYALGRKLHGLQPFKTLDWIYRAFVKT